MRYFLNVYRTGFVYIGLRFYTGWAKSGPTHDTAGETYREMGCYKRSKVVGAKCLGHAIGPSANTAVILVSGRSSCMSAVDRRAAMSGSYWFL